MNANYTLDRFTQRISDLPIQPELAPDELKSRFDACPEELREVHNALALHVEQMEQENRMVSGTYNGSGGTQTVSVGFTPRAVLVSGGAAPCQLALDGAPAASVRVVSGGFAVSDALNSPASPDSTTFRYLAFA